MNRTLFKFAKSLVPKLSDTELIALRSGTTCVDRHIFEGKVPIAAPPKPLSEKTKLCTTNWMLFLNNMETRKCRIQMFQNLCLKQLVKMDFLE